MTTIKTRWVLTDELEIYPTTITGKQIARLNQDENKILHEVIDPFLETYHGHFEVSGNGSLAHAREYLNNELHK